MIHLACNDSGAALAIRTRQDSSRVQCLRWPWSNGRAFGSYPADESSILSGHPLTVPRRKTAYIGKPESLEELILGVTAKLNDVDPRAWLADVLRRIADHPVQRLDELLPWHWVPQTCRLAA